MLVVCGKKHVKSFAKLLFDVYKRLCAHHIFVWGRLKNYSECECKNKLVQQDNPDFGKLETSNSLFAEEVLSIS